MPVRSSASSVLKWPDPGKVRAAAQRWAERQQRARADLIRLGVFGSYARGDAGVGSDLDLVAIVADADAPFARRAAAWDLTPLPVQAEIVVYTEAEWRRLSAAATRFARTLERETVWLI